MYHMLTYLTNSQIEWSCCKISIERINSVRIHLNYCIINLFCESITDYPRLLENICNMLQKFRGNLFIHSNYFVEHINRFIYNEIK